MAYVCNSCGLSYVKWQGKCDSCQAWNGLVPFQGSAKRSPLRGKAKDQLPSSRPKKLADIELASTKRISCSDEEFNRVLGGGIVPGSLVVLGGEPGIGKSTLLLQVALQLQGVSVLYVSGEETESQIKIRAARLALDSSNCFFVQEDSLTQVLKHVAELQPAVLIVDSIQTLYDDAEEGVVGSVHQIKACTAHLLHCAKHTGVAVFLVGHINKEGALAGPKLLEHMVDVVLQFEGDKPCLYRMVRTVKNRFGPTSELGIYEMKAQGLQAVANPSAALLSQQDRPLSGIAIGSCLEGSRALMIEIQALVTATRYGNPQRNATGYDPKRLIMLLAVLEKRAGLRLNDRDVFLNITGGLKAEDTALDLAVCMAIASSLQGKVRSNRSCFIAEMGLGGELRPVAKLEHRIAEAAKLGFQEVFVSAHHPHFVPPSDLKIHRIEALKTLVE